MTIRLTDKELLKSVLYEDRHADANAALDEDIGARRAASLQFENNRQLAKKRRRRRTLFMRTLIPVALILLAVAGLIAYDYAVSWNRIHPNVVAGGIEIGGKTTDEAQEFLDQRLAEYLAHPISIVHDPVNDPALAETDTSDDASDDDEDAAEPQVWEMYAEEIELSFETTVAVEEAYEFGRDANILTALHDRLMSYFEPHYVDLRSIVNEEMAVEEFQPMREAINVASVDSRVIREDDQFVVESGSDGIALNEIELVVLMTYAILVQDFEVGAPVEEDPRDIDDQNAQRAAHTANEAIALPVSVNYNEKSWDFDTGDIATLLAFARNDALEENDAVLPSGEATPTTEFWLEAAIPVDEVREHVVGRLGADVGRAPVNARFSVSDGQVIIHPSEIGSGVDSEQLALDLAAVLMDQDPEARSVEVTMNDIEPRLTTEGAEAMGIRERIATYTIPFTAGNAPRTHNVQLISSMISGITVAPGEEFSFNQTTGGRTAAQGFQAAGVIVGGEMSTAVGGGICQVSSVLFNTSMQAGVQITQRQNHSMFLSQYPIGRDAAVAAGGPDFRFRNTLDNYILIIATATGSSATVSFYGVDPGYDITLRTGDFSRTNYGTREIRDNTLSVGTRVVETRGVRGGTVNVYYTVRSGDTVVRQQTFTSHFRSTDEVVRVGTMEPSDDDE